MWAFKGSLYETVGIDLAIYVGNSPLHPLARTLNFLTYDPFTTIDNITIFIQEDS